MQSNSKFRSVGERSDIGAADMGEQIRNCPHALQLKRYSTGN